MRVSTGTRVGNLGSKCNDRTFLNKIENGNCDYQFTPKRAAPYFAAQHHTWLITRGNVLETRCKKKCATPDYTERSNSLCSSDDYNKLGYLAQSDCLAADRQDQGDTRLTLTPSVIPNSNYVIMVSD
jgi:hypothetical protein